MGFGTMEMFYASQIWVWMEDVIMAGINEICE